jgi:hypothetical protein
LNCVRLSLGRNKFYSVNTLSLARHESESCRLVRQSSEIGDYSPVRTCALAELPAVRRREKFAPEKISQTTGDASGFVIWIPS